jgi:hypothetical protein
MSSKIDDSAQVFPSRPRGKEGSVNWNRFVYKSHKWLAVAAVLLTFVWFSSGVVMVLPSPLFSSAGKPVPSFGEPAASMRDAVVRPVDAIAAVDQVAGKTVQVRSVSFRALPGRIAYVVATTDAGTHLVDAVSCQPVIVNEELARQIAAELLPAGAQVREASILKGRSHEYSFGPVPAYRFVADDTARTIVYVGVQTGEARSTDRAGRIRAFLAGAHSLEFLHPYLQRRFVANLMLLLGSVGTLMTLFGAWILWLQFLNWRRARRKVVSG